MADEDLKKKLEAVPVVPFSTNESPFASTARTVAALTDAEAQQRRIQRIVEESRLQRIKNENENKGESDGTQD
jgi:hypothetical protein